MPDFLEGDYRGLIGGDSSNNRASTSAVTGNRDGSILERLENLIGMGVATATSSAQLLVNGTTIFTIAGGPIRIFELVSYCTVTMETVASTLQWSADGTVGAATTFTGASSSLTGIAAGGVVYCTFVALNTAPVITQTAGVALSGSAGITVPAGIITTVIGGADSATGKWVHYLRYAPYTDGVTVTAS